MSGNNDEKMLLPHHIQRDLCTTRLPYRQGRKLTAVKAYTVNSESNHLLVFGVPSLNLRQEAKALFAKFGKLLQFTITTEHPAEVFTETYHAKYESIQSARIAKKMLDTKNFYGGSLHVCYAPETESLDETRQKLLQRKQNVLSRLRYLDMQSKRDDIKNLNVSDKQDVFTDNEVNTYNKRTMNMGEVNTIILSKKKKDAKIKNTPIINEVNFEDSSKNDRNYIESTINASSSNLNKKYDLYKPDNDKKLTKKYDFNVNKPDIDTSNNLKQDKCNGDLEIVDFTSADKEIVSNINEALNYKNFGNEIIKKVPYKPVNMVVFNVNNKKRLIYLLF